MNHRPADAYRTAPPAQRCAVCDAEALCRCPRCGRPLCTLHAVSDNTRCQECEDAFAVTRRRVVRGTAAAAATVGLVVGGLLATTWLYPGTIAALVLLAVGPVTAAGALLGHLARRRFLAAGDGELMLGQLAIAPRGGPAPRARRNPRGWTAMPRGGTQTTTMWPGTRSEARFG